jgi:hypothetical protein
MLRDALVSLIKARCKRTADTNLDATIVSEMQFIHTQVLEKNPVKPWFLLSPWTAVSISSGVDYTALPSNFYFEHEEFKLEVYNSDEGKYIPLEKADAGAAEKYYLYNDTSAPLVYSIEGLYFLFYPVPDQDYTARFRYYVRDTSLATNIENNWTKYAADVLLGEVGKVIAGQYLRDETLRTYFEGISNEAWARLRSENEARKVAGQSTAMQYG